MAPKRAFTQAKQQALTKHDKSSATSFDARVVGLCAAANESPYVFTTSSCSGRHLLTLELPTLVALFVRTFDAELIDPIPEPNWAYRSPVDQEISVMG